MNRIPTKSEVERVLKPIVEVMGLGLVTLSGHGDVVGHVPDRDAYEVKIIARSPWMRVEFGAMPLVAAASSPEALYDYIFEITDTARRELAHGLRDFADKLDAFTMSGQPRVAPKG